MTTHEILLGVLTAMAPVLITILGRLSKRAAVALDERTEATREQRAANAFFSVLAKLNDAAGTAVAVVAQTYVDGLKAALADDGKISDAERVKAKRMAIQKAKAYLGSAGLGELKRAFHLTDTAELDELIGDKIEAAVRAQKGRGEGLALLLEPHVGEPTPTPTPAPRFS
jgi:hypothetical protein